MASFASLSSKPRPPGKTLVLPLSVFADEWIGKPNAPVCVGLRQLSEADKTKTRGESEKLANEVHPNGGENWLDCYNDALMRQVAALGICDPNDVMKPTEILPLAEDLVRVALTSSGAQFIFEAIRAYEIETSPLDKEATEEEVEELADMIVDRYDDLEPVQLRALRAILVDLKA